MSNDRETPPLPHAPRRASSSAPTVRGRPGAHSSRVHGRRRPLDTGTPPSASARCADVPVRSSGAQVRMRTRTSAHPPGRSSGAQVRMRTRTSAHPQGRISGAQVRMRTRTSAHPPGRSSGAQVRMRTRTSAHRPGRSSGAQVRMRTRTSAHPQGRISGAQVRMRTRTSAHRPGQAPSSPPRTSRRHLAALIPFLLAACTSLKVDPFPEPLRPPRDAPADAVAPDVVDPRSRVANPSLRPASSSRNPWPKALPTAWASNSPAHPSRSVSTTCRWSHSSTRSSASASACPSSSPPVSPKAPKRSRSV